MVLPAAVRERHRALQRPLRVGVAHPRFSLSKGRSWPKMIPMMMESRVRRLTLPPVLRDVLALGGSALVVRLRSN